MQTPNELEVSPGAVVRRFSSEESRALAEVWLAAFGGKGAPNMKDYMWHVLSFQAHPSVSLQEAKTQYNQQVALSYIVLSNDRDQALETDLRPTSCNKSDFYVFPPNLAWTMAFTHEDGWLGPYFAKHARYVDLNQQNIAKIEKNQAIENARQKGWLRR